MLVFHVATGSEIHSDYFIVSSYVSLNVFKASALMYAGICYQESNLASKAKVLAASDRKDGFRNTGVPCIASIVLARMRIVIASFRQLKFSPSPSVQNRHQEKIQSSGP